MGPYDQFFQQQRQAQQMQRPQMAQQMAPQQMAAMQALRARAQMPMGQRMQPPQGMDAYASLLQQGQRQPQFPGARAGGGGLAGQPPSGMASPGGMRR